MLWTQIMVWTGFNMVRYPYNHLSFTNNCRFLSNVEIQLPTCRQWAFIIITHGRECHSGIKALFLVFLASQESAESCWCRLNHEALVIGLWLFTHCCFTERCHLNHPILLFSHCCYLIATVSYLLIWWTFLQIHCFSVQADSAPD